MAEYEPSTPNRCVERTWEFITERWQQKDEDEQDAKEGPAKHVAQDEQLADEDVQSTYRQDKQDGPDTQDQQDRPSRQGRPKLVISVLSDKEPLSVSQRSLKSIVYNLVNAADEAKGEHVRHVMK